MIADSIRRILNVVWGYVFTRNQLLIHWLRSNIRITESASQEEVTINFWHHYSAQSAENETLMNVLIPEFEKENPGNCCD